MITRRGFLGRVGGAAAALGAARQACVGSASRADAAQAARSIDTHTHFYDPARPQGVPWPRPDETLLYRRVLPPEFEALAAKHGVVGTVVVEASPWVEDNQWVLDLAEKHTMIVGFVGNLEVGRPGFAANLRRFGRNPLFRGLRLGERAVAAGLGRRAFEDDLRRMGERSYALDLIGGPSVVAQAARVARLAPGLRVVIDHLPFEAWDGDGDAMRRALAEVADLPRVYAKVSAVARRLNGAIVEDPASYRPRLDALWEAFGPDRVIFGSNWPVSERVAPYAVVHRLVAAYVGQKGRAAREKFFWRNSLAAYRWQPRGAAKGLVRGLHSG
jgi:L-fuconolactonase